MSVKIITAPAAAVLIGSTAMASAQTRAFPRDNYWNDGFYGPSVNFGIGVSPYGRATMTTRPVITATATRPVPIVA